MQSSEPEVFGEYLLLRRLAEGNLAEALVAVRLGDRSGRTFVVKRPRLGERASGPAAQATKREGEVLSAVRSPHLIALEGVGTAAGLPFVVLEHVRGVPLDRLLTQVGPLAAPEAVAIARDVLAALAALHEGGWVHGDVAPSNVMIDETGEAKLLDLGIAARIGEKRPGPAGKPGYVAPEAMGGRPVSPSEDAYAWGVVLAECLLGRRLFVERDLSEAATREGPPPAVTQLPAWGPLLEKVLALDEQRRPKLAELAAELANAPIDRSALAETVAHVQQAGDPRGGDRPSRSIVPVEPRARELTPTAPPAAVTPTLASEPVASVPPEGGGPHGEGLRVDGPRVDGRRGHLKTVIVASIAAALGVFAGRRFGGGNRNARGASVGLSAALPARALLQIDGRVIATPEPGKDIPVQPGRRTITLSLPRKDPMVFDIVVDPGEHVVLLLPVGVKRVDRARADGADEGNEPP